MDPIAGTCSQRPAGAAAQRGSAPLRARCRALPGSGPAVRKGRCASPLKRLPSTPLLTGLPPRFFRHWRRSAPPPGVSAPTFLLPMSNRRNAGGGALAQGRRETLGYAGGGGVWQAEGRPCGPPLGRQTKERPRGQRPRGRSFRARSAQPPPPSAGVLPCQASGPLPMSGPPACSAGKPETFSSQFSPAFLKAGRGCGGRAAPARSPQRGPGQRPWRGPGQRPGSKAPAAAQGRRTRSPVGKMEGYSLTPT